ncbi:MAG: hypothetical protein VYA86_01635 [Candidatus Thermoplasmatota archaeon]|nr:hypothetical protein [Candidatus Thermoplasmatota archaeon]
MVNIEEKCDDVRENARKTALGARRPSQQRRTEEQSEPCDTCGVNEWNRDLGRGEIYCGECGRVALQNAIDPGPEWTNHSEGIDRSRVGAPMRESITDKGLNTTISLSDIRGVGATRNGISGSDLRDWNRRAAIDRRENSSRARSMNDAMQLIRRQGLASVLVEESARFYRCLANKDFVRGRTVRGVAAASVYLAAREMNLPRTIPELAKSFDCEEKILGGYIRKATRILNTHKITSPAEYLDKFHNGLDLIPRVLGDAFETWELVKNAEVWQGKKPMGVAAALLYLCARRCGDSRTQAQVCGVAGISEVTLRLLLKPLKRLVNS